MHVWRDGAAGEGLMMERVEVVAFKTRGSKLGPLPETFLRSPGSAETKQPTILVRMHEACYKDSHD